MGVLDGLLRIKQFREDKAEREVARARERLEAARQAVLKARIALDEYLDHCDAREAELYRDLLSRIVHKADVDDVAVEVKLMREQIPTYEQALKDAQTAQQQAEQGLEEARRAHQAAIRMREKFTTLVDEEILQLREEGLRNEERELEEVPLRSAHAANGGMA